MVEELFDDELASLAMDIINEKRDDVNVYSRVESDVVVFECVSAEDQAFIIQRVNECSSTRLHTFILPYHKTTFEDIQFNYIQDLSRGVSECFLCGEASSDAMYSHKGQEHYLHSECAEQYNNTLSEMLDEIQPHKGEIESKILAQRV